MATLDYEALIECRAKIRKYLSEAREARDIEYIRGSLREKRDEYDLLVARHASIENELTRLTGIILTGLLLDTDLDAPKDAIIQATESLTLTYDKIEQVRKMLSILADFSELISTIVTSVSTGSLAQIGSILAKIDAIAASF